MGQLSFCLCKERTLLEIVGGQSGEQMVAEVTAESDDLL